MLLFLAVSMISGGSLALGDLSYRARPTGVFTRSPVLRADANADGAEDLVVLAGDGADVFVVPGPRAAGTPYGLDAGPGLVAQAVGDLTGDGRADLVTTRSDGGPVGVLEVRAAAADGTFGRPLRTRLADPPAPAWSGDALQVGDVTGDGLQDVVVRLLGVRQGVAIYRGDGTGHLEPLAVLDLDSQARDVRLAQLDDDAALELVVAVVSSPLSFRSFGIDDGQTPTLLFAFDPVVGVSDFVLGDLDGDGWDELVGRPSPAGASVFVWRAQGDGSLAPPTSQVLDVRPTRLEDVDGDGLLDLVGRRRVAPGLGNLAFGPARVLAFCEGPGTGPGGAFPGARWETFHPEDLDGDGDLDLLALTGSDDDGLVVLAVRRDASGEYERDPEASEFLPLLDTAPPRTFADVDGDGFTDLVTLNVVGSVFQLTVAPADGAGGFGPRYGVAMDVPGGSLGLAGSGDFDGDGWFDLVTSVFHPGQGTETTLFFQVAPGRFGAPVPTGVSSVQTSFGGADVDGDGRTDLVSVPAQSTAQVHFGDPAGLVPGPVFTQPALFGSFLADVNADGRADLLRHRTDGVEVWLGRADRTFDGPVVRLLPPVSFGGGASEAVGDVDGDGDLDLVLRRGSTNVLLSGAGNGSFGPVVTLQDTRGGPLLLADLDDDGVLDMYSDRSDRLQILRGAGNGLFDERLDFGLEYDDFSPPFLQLVRFVAGRRQLAYRGLAATPRLKFVP